MKQIIILTIFLGLLNCKDAPKDVKTDMAMPRPEKKTPAMEYPEEFGKILYAHGGLENWKKQRTLTFEIAKPDATEKHTIDLYSRKDKIEMPNVSMGYDGNNVWLDDEKKEYKGNAEVYHNLMFYFYAMPFVLADKGVHYEKSEDFVFEGVHYPGIHITFDEGIGASSKDDYYLHYDTDTNRMAWLGYTFTFGSNEKSDKVNWIRYDDWMKVGEVMLPGSISWYVNEGRELKGPRNKVVFENVSLSIDPRPADFYAQPEKTISN